MKKKFYYLWTSQILSQLTLNTMNFVFLAHLYKTTGSAIATSLLWVAYSLPALLIGPIGAASVDLLNRRHVLMITNLLQAATIFAYLFTNQQSIFILYAIVFAYSALNQFYVPAEAATLPSTVTPSSLPHANSMFFLTNQATVILGFGFAGILQNIIGLQGSLIVATIFLFVAFISVSFLEEVKPRKKLPGEIEMLLKTFFNTIIEGYRLIKDNKQILFPLLILLGVQASLAVIIVSLPVLATEVLNIPVDFAGVSLVVPAGIGAILGSFAIPRLLKKGWRKKTIIDVGLSYTAISLLTLSVIVPYLDQNLRVALTPVLITLAGVAFVGINLPALTFLQETTPKWFRGRVFGNLWFMTALVSILPVLFSGAVTELFGVRTLMTILALIALAVLVFSRHKGQMLITTHFNNNGQ